MAARLRRACALLLAASLATSCGGGRDASEGRPEGRPSGAATPVVVDTDLAVDDVVALSFLLSSTEVDVRAVTVSGTGEVRCPQGLKVIRALLAVTDDERIPVACGRSTPLRGDHEFPTEWRDTADVGWGMDLSSVTAPATERSAVDLLDSSLRQGGVTLLTLGPLTDVAESFRAHSDLAEKVSSIVVMGGAVDVPGNVFGEGIESSTAEWNMYVDPTAAAEVLTSGAPVVQVGLDATNQLPITPEFLEQLRANSHTRAAKLVYGLIRDNVPVGSGQAYFWDPLAAAVTVKRDLVATEKAAISVVTTPGPDEGRTVRSEEGTRVTIARRPRATDFRELLLRTLDGLEPDAALAAPPPPVGNAMIRFDHGTCSYDGPSTVRSGRMRFTFETTDPAQTAAVVGLTGQRSIEWIVGWIKRQVRHPSPPVEAPSGPPGVRMATPVPPGAVSYVDVVPPSIAAVCTSERDPIPLVASTVTVE